MPRSADPARAGAPPPFAHVRDPRHPSDSAAAEHQDLHAALRRIERLVAQQARLEQEVLELREANRRALQLAHHDALTGLPNRNLLQDRFTQALALAMRQRKQVALVFLDLDAFKRVNDVLGHTVGDRLLQQVAARLSACVRSSDTACRYGGDEFVVLLPNLDDAQSAVVVARKILANLAAPYCVEGRPIAITTSIGVAFYPGDGTECGTLLRVADRAMYRDKGRERADGPLDWDRPFPAAVDDRAAATPTRPAGAGETPLATLLAVDAAPPRAIDFTQFARRGVWSTLPHGAPHATAAHQSPLHRKFLEPIPVRDRTSIMHAYRMKQPARQPGDFKYMIRFVTGGCPSTDKVTLTIDGRSTSRYRALMAILPFVALNRATESSGSETVYLSA